MPIKKVLIGASLLLLAFSVVPAAYAQNSDDGTTVTQPQKRVVDPAKRAARQAARKQRREARRQARMQQRQNGQNGQTTAPSPN